MKKSLFILPFLMAPILLGCNKSKPTYFEVTFDTLSGSPVPETQKVKKDSTAIEPDKNPTIMGANFKYWTLDVSVETPTEFDFNTPIVQDITLYAYYTSEQLSRVVFNAGSGHFGDNVDSKKKVMMIKKETKYKDISVPTPTLDDYTFKGYSRLETISEDGEVIDPETTFGAFYLTNVYASYSYVHTDLDIKLSDTSTTFELGEIKAPSPKDDGIVVPIKIKDECRQKFVVPTDKSRIIIKDGKGTIINDFTYMSTSEIRGVINLKKNYTNYKLTITLPDNQPCYTFDPGISTSEHLKITHPNRVPRGEDYIFTIEVNQDERNGEMYKLPASLNIYVGDSEFALRPHCYEIVPDSINPHTKAEVTIRGEFIKDDVTLKNNKAVPTEAIPLVIDGRGLNCYPSDFVIPDSQKFTLTIKPQGDTNHNDVSDVIPDANHVLFSLDAGNTWKVVANTEGCTYDRSVANQATLTVDLTKVTIPASFEIMLRATDSQILDLMSWDEIAKISESGLAPNFFYLGDKKHVDLSMDSEVFLTHDIQIIDFNHDELADDSGNKAGITFEFDTLLSGSSWEGTPTHFDVQWQPGSEMGEGDSHDYINSVLNKSLSETGNVYVRLNECLPDLVRNIKEVKKGVVTSPSKGSLEFSLTTYEASFFPLSTKEMFKNFTDQYKSDIEEGTTYAFYNNDDENINVEHRKKIDLADNSWRYWLRSPGDLEIACELTYSVNSDTASYNHEITESMWSVAPAFCI